MNELWEIYIKNIDGLVASVQCNMGLIYEIDELQLTFPTLGFIKVTLKEPKENGLLSDEEEPEILFLEDKIESALIKFRVGKYAGRVISDGSVTFIFYLQFTYNWQDFLDFALDEFDSYSVTQGLKDDPSWAYYTNLLFPNIKEQQIINNHKVCDKLKESGDTLETPRMIEHKFIIQESTNRTMLVEQMKNYGFELQNDQEETLSFYRKDKPFYYDIDQITLELIDLAVDSDALYDGWETSVVKFA